MINFLKTLKVNKHLMDNFTLINNSDILKFNSKILNGTLLSKAIKEDLKSRLELMQKKYSITDKPKLKIILIGNRNDSRVYVHSKIKVCKYIGLESELKKFDENVKFETIIDEIEISNSDKNIHGIIVQLPIPLQLEPYKTDILSKVQLDKDVDGLNPIHQGRILQMKLNKSLVPPTAMGVLELLRLGIKYENNLEKYIQDYLINKSFTEEIVDLSNLDICILGRGLTAGLPISILMQKCNGTVTVCHSYSDREKIIEKLGISDIIISAVGKKNLILAKNIKENSIIIDVGISFEVDKMSGIKKICGDVEFEECLKKSKYITPVPGGVGRMTVVMLIKNVIKAWSISHGIDINDINEIYNN